MSRTDSTAPLSITTEDLTLTIEGVRMDVRSTGERVFVEVPTVRGAIRVARSLPDGVDADGPAKLLTAADLTTEIRVRGRTVIVFGSDARPGPLARRLGIAPAEPRLSGFLGAGWAGLVGVPVALRRLFR
ncbi:hypothetical protein J2751_000554 [Halorubrum alkaliphilum]|uniref:Peptide ABC transporter ATP-binding protein n=1 Tax=Halorubrum alkaliphilum TaxID=261290 RepID=A0A8T4GDJ8_9EURY|nr:peptide ABC transporter ATP-binding protein [Halorubrum alkaliphilum]MBP1921561.1 hypothetical protein [Halorubrum alkaliphilum]